MSQEAITIQQWLDFLENEKRFAGDTDRATTPRIVGIMTLLISSILACFQAYPFYVLGIIGILFSIGFIIWINRLINQVIIYVTIVDEIIIKILDSQLITVGEISKEYHERTRK